MADVTITAGLTVDTGSGDSHTATTEFEFDLDATTAGDIEERASGTQVVTNSAATLGTVDAALGGVIEWAEISGLWIKNIGGDGSEQDVKLRRGATEIAKLSLGEAMVFRPITDGTNMLKVITDSGTSRIAWVAVGPRA